MRLRLAIAVALAAASSAFADSVPSADEIRRQIKTEEARVVLTRLWATPAVFEEICRRIETGEADWLEVAQGLKPASDAAASLSLNYAVARALPVAPTRVLALINHGFSVQDICTSPFIDPETGVAERYQRKAIEALSKPQPSELENIRKDCVDQIRVPLSAVPK